MRNGQSPQSLMITGLVLSSLLALGACGKGGFNEPMAVRDEYRLRLPQEPTENLVTTTKPKAATNANSKYYNVYDLIEFKIAPADMARRELSARAVIQSTAGTETVDLLGKIRNDGTASLVDINPVSENQHRLTAEAYCSDKEECTRIIVNVYYKVSGRTLKKQFVSKAMLPDENEGTADNHEHSDESNNTTSPTSPASPAAPSSPASPAANPVDTKDEVFDHGNSDPNDPNNELNGKDQVGEYVGAQPNQDLIAQLIDRPEDPVALPSDDPSDVAATNSPVPLPEPIPQEENQSQAQSDDEEKASPSKDDSKPQPISPSQAQPQPQSTSPNSSNSPSPSSSDDELWFWQRWAKRLMTPTSPVPGRKPQPPPTENEKSEQEQATAPKAPSTAPAPMPSAIPKPNPSPVPAVSQAEPPSGSSFVPDRKPQPPKPPTAVAQDVPKPSISEFETKIASLMDVVDGGHAIGTHYTTFEKGKKVRSAIENATALPATGQAFKWVHIGRNTNHGTGMIISLLENATSYLATQYYPGTKVMIGDISQPKGGVIIRENGKPSQHDSHQNGLDVDIPYIDQAFGTSIVRGAGVKSNFNFPKHWQFFRIIANQQIVQDGKSVTVLNRIFVNPVVKKAFCSWAKKNNVLKNPLDLDIMRRIRPEGGHDKHFHVRLKCSPHYPECRNQIDVTPAFPTGC